MTNHLSPAWIIGVLLAVASIIPVSCENKVKRQLSEEPPVTYSSIPKTSFSCDLLGPGYYADMETQCAVFHVCHGNRMDSFICPGGTTFNQRVFVCDWRGNVDCDSSPDFYFLNSRIGSDEPFHTSVLINFPSRRAGDSTAATIDGSRIARTGTVPDSQLGSPSQARVKTVKPDGPTGKRSDKVKITSNIRVGNALLPNTLFVEVPTFVAKVTGTGKRPATEASETLAESVTKAPGASSSRQNVLSRGKGDEKKKKNQTYGSRLREQGYLPTSTRKTNSKVEQKDGYLPLEGSGEGPSSENGGYLPLDGPDESPSPAEAVPSLNKTTKDALSSRDRGSYLPTEESGAVSPTVRGSYLPEATPEVTPSSRGSYLPEDGTDRPAGSNYLAEEPPKSPVTDASFLLPPPSSPVLQNSILGAFALPSLDEYSQVPSTTTAPRLPPMNLLPLSNEPTPPTRDSRLPSTTESYGVIDESETGTTESSATPSKSRHGSGRALRLRPKVGDQGKNAIAIGKKTARRPATEATTTTATPEFQYDFDRVRNALQERLRNVEPFDVPAEITATSNGATVALPSGSTQSEGMAPPPWLYSLAKVSM